MISGPSRSGGGGRRSLLLDIGTGLEEGACEGISRKSADLGESAGAEICFGTGVAEFHQCIRRSLLLDIGSGLEEGAWEGIREKCAGLDKGALEKKNFAARLRNFWQDFGRKFGDEGGNFGKANGFTLAEVLITLGVIGIVAAMTLPGLINNQRNKALQTALKKAYSRHSEALMLVKAEAGVDNILNEFGTYDKNLGSFTRRNEFINMYKSKLKIIGECKYSRPQMNYNNTAEAYVDMGSSNQTPWLLADGTCCNVGINASRIGLSVDVNGTQKGPNRLGHDIFIFHVTKQGIWEPVKMTKLYTDDELESKKNEYLSQSENGELSPGQAATLKQMGYPCSTKTNQAGNGMGCSWYAINDISPDDSSARYWENLPK